MTHTLAKRLVALVAVAPLLAGCGGSSNEQPDETPRETARVPSSTGSSTSSAASESSSADASQAPTGDYPVPAAAKAHTEAGAKAFGIFYTRVLGEAGHRGDRALVDRFSDQSCVRCKDVGDYITGVSAKGRRSEINPYEEVTSSELPSASTLDRPLVRTRFSMPEHWDVTTAGKRLEKTDAKTGTFIMALSWTGQSWSVVELGSDE